MESIGRLLQRHDAQQGLIRDGLNGRGPYAYALASAAPCSREERPFERELAEENVVTLDFEQPVLFRMLGELARSCKLHMQQGNWNGLTAGCC